MSILTDTAPKRIYLCVSDDADDYDLPYPEIYQEEEQITWSTDSPVDCTVKYVRADIADAEIAKAKCERDVAIAVQAKAEHERDNAWDTCKRALHKVDNLIARAEKAEKDHDDAEVERDDAIRDVERLRAMLPPTAYTGVRNGPGEGSWAVFAQKVVEERDALVDAIESIHRQLIERAADDATTPLLLTYERCVALYEAIATLQADFAVAQKELGECSGGYQTLEKELAAARAEIARLHVAIDAAQANDHRYWNVPDGENR